MVRAQLVQEQHRADQLPAAEATELNTQLAADALVGASLHEKWEKRYRT